MGTRALISKNGKPFIATHWDGYPSSLGADLLEAGTSDDAILKVAARHSINAAATSVLKKAEALAQQAWKKREPQDKREKLVWDIKGYGDFAEYQYDVKGDKWFFRPLPGEYPASLKKAGALKPLTTDAVKGD